MDQLIELLTDSWHPTGRVMCRHGIEQGVTEVAPGIFEPKIRASTMRLDLSNQCTFTLETITTLTLFACQYHRRDRAPVRAAQMDAPGISMGCDDIQAAYRRIQLSPAQISKQLQDQLRRNK